MTPDGWQRIKEICYAAVARPVDEQPAFVRDACVSDEAMRMEIESLLVHGASAASFLETPAAARVISAAAPEASMVGRELGPYQVTALLGAGGMGEVYKARDTRLEREVALKLLKNQSDPLAIERFFREARAASALNHPNIVTVFDAGVAGREHFIVMELVRGVGLRSLIGQPMNVERFVAVARQIAEALSVAHDAGIVHRDVKPENIMVRDDGYVKVVDFGLARLSPQMEATAETQTVIATRQHAIVGTFDYMSPEQAAGDPVGAASDVFSLGVVLYELATGRHPFEAATYRGLLHAIVAHHPAPPSRLNPELSGRLETLILRMLEKDASRRPTASEVAAEFTITRRPPTGGTQRSEESLPLAPTRHIVGRVKARGELRAALDHVAKGRGLLVSVSGEPGIGKSTLVEDFLAELSNGEATCHVGHGRCSERLAGTEAYLPLLDALEGLVRGEDGVLARLMKELAPLWYAQIVPAGFEDSSWKSLAASGTQERFKRELVAFLAEACRQRPVVFFFDDLHWVDISTIDMLSYVTRQFESLPVLIIASYRPEELLVQKHPFLSMKRDLQSRGLCRDIELEFLTRGEAEQCVAAMFPNHRFPHRFVDLIYAKTEGSPLFIVEVLSYLSEQHVLALEHGEWRLTRSLPDIASDLPASVRSMIQRKIDILADFDRRLLSVASVQGVEFDDAVVAKVLDAAQTDVEERLDVLERIHGLVRRVREHEFPDRTPTLRYTFVHVLYQNMLYASLAPARKASLSRAVGMALEGLYGEKATDLASELAVLYEVARERAFAADYFSVAAKKAASVFAYEEALALGQRALHMLAALADTADRRRRELDILMIMGVPATATRGYSSREVQEIYGRASALCLEFHETERLALALWRLFAVNVVRLQLETAQEIVDRLRDLVPDGQESSLIVQGALARGLVAFYRGEFESSADCFGRAAAHDDPDLRRSISVTLGYDPAVASESYLGHARLCLGYPDSALRATEAALRSADENAHSYTLAYALQQASVVCHWRGDWERLRAHVERALALTEKGGFSYFSACALYFKGRWLNQQGRWDEGLDRMREGFDRIRAIEGRVSLRRFTSDFAEQLAHAGRLRDGLDLVAAEFAVKGSARFWDTELIRVHGELLLMRGGVSDTAEAERCFAQALDLAREQRAKSFELRAAISLARLWRAQGKSQQAASRLSETYGWFTEGFDTADLREAHTLLSATGVNVG